MLDIWYFNDLELGSRFAQGRSGLVSPFQISNRGMLADKALKGLVLEGEGCETWDRVQCSCGRVASVRHTRTLIVGT